MIKNLLTSIHGIAGICTAIVWVDTLVAPVLPSVWQNLIVAVLGVLSFYKGSQAVGAARAVGAKGL